MKYVSTRGAAPALDFEGVVLSGLAPDGGLYVPADWPQLGRDDIAALAGLPYGEVAARVMAPFVGGSVAPDDFRAMIDDAYAGFRHQAVAPLRQIGAAEWLLELFHGPTLAFKDIALQLLARLFDHLLERRGRRVTIVGATSGDTGSAAIEAFRDRERVDIFILHPCGRISEVQRRQMTTVASANVRAIAIDGSFDDCQDLVKAMFADAGFRNEIGLAAVNSINWARVMAQTVYYVAAAVALGAPARQVRFAVPTGNFGDVFAGYVAARMGLPIERLLVATNRNDILARFFESGEYRRGTVHSTMSPSMDIQVASNFERLLFDLHDRDGARVGALMAAVGQGGFAVDGDRLAAAREWFDAARVYEDQTLATMAEVHRRSGLLIDPHSAVGVAAARARPHIAAVPVVALATAHPAKFPDAVERATGIRPALPPHLADIMDRDERYEVLPDDLAAVQGYIRDSLRGGP